MTVYEATLTKIHQLPEPLAQEVGDFIDFLLLRGDSHRWQLWTQFNEGLILAESDFSTYLSSLEEYEDRLARGDIQW